MRALEKNVDALFVLILNDDNEDDDDEKARRRIHSGRGVFIERFITIHNPVIALSYVLFDFVLLYHIT